MKVFGREFIEEEPLRCSGVCRAGSSRAGWSEVVVRRALKVGCGVSESKWVVYPLALQGSQALSIKQSLVYCCHRFVSGRELSGIYGSRLTW